LPRCAKKKDAEELRQLHQPNLIPICPLDLSRPGDIPPVMEILRAELQRRGQAGLYALINNAGGGGVAPVELIDLDVFRTELQTRLVGALARYRACLPLIRQVAGALSGSPPRRPSLPLRRQHPRL